MVNKKGIKLINKSTYLSLIIGVVIFLISRPHFVNALDWRDILDTNFEVDTAIDDNNYRQIIIRDDNGSTHFLTEDNTTHANPSYGQNYIAWMAIVDRYWQIFVYDIKAKTFFQLTNSENNVNPKVDGEKIVWEGQRNGVWQIFMFDGLRISQITKDDNPKQDVEIKNEYITFSQKNNQNNIWEIVLYNVNIKTTEIISSNYSSRMPKINDNKIVWETSEDEDSYWNEYDILNKKLQKTIKTDGTSDKSLSDNVAGESPVMEDTTPIEELTEEDIAEEINNTTESTPSFEEVVIEEVKETTQSTSSTQ